VFFIKISSPCFKVQRSLLNILNSILRSNNIVFTFIYFNMTLLNCLLKLLYNLHKFPRYFIFLTLLCLMCALLLCVKKNCYSHDTWCDDFTGFAVVRKGNVKFNRVRKFVLTLLNFSNGVFR
jgi:hypothetical protein